MSSIDSITSSFELIKSIQSDITKAFCFLNDITKKVKEEKTTRFSQLPYHINVIDELHINENAHSRILAKLLQFKNSYGVYELLESFICFIKGRNTSSDFERLKIKSPVITQEKERIDLWVRDYATKYAIIFENKIYDANDQDAQLFRYIEKTRNCDFSDTNIFILYLTQFGDDPSEQTWGGEKEGFQNRYLAISFRDDILVWLKNCVIPNIRQKDTYLLCAVSQYIDYLEGLFSIRTIHKSLNMGLQKIISEQLSLESCGELEAINKIRDTIKDFQEVTNQLNSMLREKRREYWKKQLNLANPHVLDVGEMLGLQSEISFNNEHETRFYISFKKEEWNLSIVLERYNNTVFVYIGYPGERKVDEQYQNSGIYVFKEHTAPQTEPYGWEYIDRYHQTPENLVQDINNGAFKEFLNNLIRRIHKDITDKNIKM